MTDPIKTKVKAVIVSVELKKSGETNGKKWKIFDVSANVDGQTRKFGSFDDLTGNINSECDVEIWEEEKPDKNDPKKIWKNWKIALPRFNPASEIRDLQRRVQSLEAMLLGKKGLENATSPQDEQIDEDYKTPF